MGEFSLLVWNKGIVSLNIGHTTITVLVITLTTIEEPVPKRGKSSASSEVGQSVTTSPWTADGINFTVFLLSKIFLTVDTRFRAKGRNIVGH